MKLYYKDEYVRLFQGDCLEVMDKLIQKEIKVDMILADLPYGITSCKWDTIIPFEPLWEQYERVIKDNGAIVLFGQEPFSSYLRVSNIENFKYDWYWEKERLTNIAQAKKRAGKTVETISVFYKKQCTYNPQMQKYEGKKRTNKVKNGKLGKLIDDGTRRVKEYQDTGWRYPTQVLSFQRDILTSNLHPTQKPVALCEYLIKTYTNEGEIVLDNCAGSGTTAIAAHNTGRFFIGIEKEPKYVEIARKRLEQAQAQQSLFA
jgi:site-specific DNA-methyltransferase (adenine-specific)